MKIEAHCNIFVYVSQKELEEKFQTLVDCFSFRTAILLYAKYSFKYSYQAFLPCSVYYVLSIRL